MSEGPARLAVLGDPLAFTLSPKLHAAGLAVLKRPGESRAFRVAPAELSRRLDELEREGYLGVNLTHPHKEAALHLVQRASPQARRARSVNTVGFGPDERWADSTDGAGFLDFLDSAGLRGSADRILFLGAGGAVRSLALALSEGGARELWVTCRHPDRVREMGDLGVVRVAAWGSDEEAHLLRNARMVVNGTPLGSRPGQVPLALERIPRQAVLVDLVYGERVTTWVASARAAGFHAFDGLGLLVHQARRSLSLWLEEAVPLAPLAQAVGWPR